MQTLLAIVSHIPTWVWGILAFILVMGMRQSREQQMGRGRLMVLPIVWLAFGVWGVDSAFGIGALPAWGVGLVLSLTLVLRSGWPGAARYDAESRSYVVAGSWMPLALMLTIFVTKFALGMGLALHPELARETSVATGFSLLFGALGGVFLGRSRNILANSAHATT
ncbi:DUF6622 family protein [Pelomonas sp. KK5]|uniref:DUF6622 family protein n=1 Tax=Pelomonas sp. KK5 TaxID=1855730 RepID=UPI00097CB0B7|nr:DUF6622 family protein [Pelomonas sp. KK5]